MITKLFYRGQEISHSDVTVWWTNHFGEEKCGSIEDYTTDYANDQVVEFDAGEGW